MTDTDLLGLGKHTPFALKSSIERAADRDSAVQAARGLPDVVCSLVDAKMDPVDVGHIVGFTIDALTRRLIGLAIERFGDASRAVGLARARQRRPAGAGSAHRPGPRAGLRPAGTHPRGGGPLLRGPRRVRHGGPRGRRHPPLRRRRDGREQRAPEVDRGMDRRVQGVDDRSGGGGQRAALDRLRLPPRDGTARRRGAARRARSARARCSRTSCITCRAGRSTRSPRPGSSRTWSSSRRASTPAGSTSSTRASRSSAIFARAASIGAGLTEKRTIGRLRAAADAGAIDDGDARPSSKRRSGSSGGSGSAPRRSRPRG